MQVFIYGYKHERTLSLDMDRSIKCDSARSEKLREKHDFFKAATCSIAKKKKKKKKKKPNSASCTIRSNNNEQDKTAQMPG